MMPLLIVTLIAVVNDGAVRRPCRKGARDSYYDGRQTTARAATENAVFQPGRVRCNARKACTGGAGRPFPSAPIVLVQRGDEVFRWVVNSTAVDGGGADLERRSHLS